MSRDDHDRYVQVPLTLNARSHSDFKPSYLQTYVALASHANLSPANDNYCRCWPSIGTIASHAGLHRATVLEALSWLAEESYIIKQKRGSRSTLYTLVLRRECFVDISKDHGRAAAIHGYEMWIAEQQHRARVRSAKTAASTRRSRSRNARPPRSSATKSPQDDFTRPGLPQPAVEVALGRLRPVASGRRSPGGDPELDPDLICRTRSKEELDGGQGPPPPPAMNSQPNCKNDSTAGDAAALIQRLRATVRTFPAAGPLTAEEFEARRRKQQQMTEGWRDS